MEMMKVELQNRKQSWKSSSRKITKRDPISVSVAEALLLVPIGKTKLYAAMNAGVIKSELKFGVRCIDYRSLKEAFALS